MTVAIPNNASTIAVEDNTTGVKYHAVWFQNFNTSTGVYVDSQATASAVDFYIPPASSATAPASLVIQSTGGDSTLVNKPWYAFQSSGGSVNIQCGRW